MYKEFKSWEEVKKFNYPNESKSEYYKYIPATEDLFPQPARCSKDESQWKICQPVEKENGIYIEVTPLWVTITIQKAKRSIKRDISRKGRKVEDIISEAFE